MKKEQKRLGNKGFSIVELIVVIAIMAVLIAILAPTLIGKIEESRESKDLQALDTVANSLVLVIGNESGYKDLVPASGNAYYTITDKCEIKSVDSLKTASTKKLQEMVESVKFESKTASASGVTIQATVTSSGKVTVSLVTGTGESAEVVQSKTDFYFITETNYVPPTTTPAS